MPIPRPEKPAPGFPSLTPPGPPLSEAAPFPFRCKGCGSCCRGRRDLVLSGLDLYRLSARLSLPPETVAEGFCDRYTGENGLPALRLRPRRDTAACPFLTGGRCAVHPARPLACALYPLGQTISLPDGTVSYFLQPAACGEPIPGGTLAQHLEDSGVKAREPADIRWAAACLSLSEWLRETPLAPLARKIALRRAEKALYFHYRLDAPFLPQLEENLAALRRALSPLQK